jgi:hypothetical protein
MTRRIWAIVLLLGFAALLLSANPTNAQARRQLPQKCPNPSPVCQSPGPTDHPTDTPGAEPTDTPTPQVEVLSLAQPSPTPPLVPDSGSAESAPVSQDNSATVLSAAPIPKNNDSFASAPGFGPIGIPLILAFAFTGLASLTILKRI